MPVRQRADETDNRAGMFQQIILRRAVSEPDAISGLTQRGNPIFVAKTDLREDADLIVDAVNHCPHLLDRPLEAGQA